MIVVSAADLKNVVCDMCRAQDKRTADALAAHREHPTMSRAEAAEALNVTLSTLCRWDKTGYLKPVRIGSKVLYRPSDIEAMLNKMGGIV